MPLLPNLVQPVLRDLQARELGVGTERFVHVGQESVKAVPFGG